MKEWIGSVETSATGDTKALTREIRDLGRKGRFEEAKEKFQQAETKDAILQLGHTSRECLDMS